jgi:uncharacterized protein
MKSSPLSAVFDCNVFLQAASRGESVAAKCLRLVEDGKIRLYVCEEILTEIEDVLNRPEIRNHFQTLSDEIVAAFLLRLRKTAHFISDVPKKFDYPRDPDDEPYINLAVEANADFLVSRDKDLLDLMTDFTIEAKQFRQKFRFLRVIKPLEFLKEIEKSDDE